MPEVAAAPDDDPQPAPAADPADDERRARERQEAIDAYNARRAELGKPPLEPERAARFVALDEEVAARAAAMRRHDERKRAQREGDEQQARRRANEIIEQARQSQRAKQERETASSAEQGEAKRDENPQQLTAPKGQPKQEKKSKILNLPLIPTTTRAVVNEIASSALFAAIQGKDRKLLNDELIAAKGDTVMYFSGEQLNQDDHDVFIQLVYLASAKQPGEYIVISAHSLLKMLGRDTGGKQHKQLDAEIERLTKATVKIKGNQFTYIGHLVHDSLKHEETKQWVYVLNEKLGVGSR